MRTTASLFNEFYRRAKAEAAVRYRKLKHLIEKKGFRRALSVMAGLDPAVHVLSTRVDGTSSRVDARVKPAHDDFWLALIKTQQPSSVCWTAPRFRGNDEKSR